MDTYSKAVVLDSEVEAQVVDAMLTERGIPHLLRSYHDSALDGLYQAQRGWGHIEAPEQFHGEIADMVDGLRRQTGSGTAG